MEINEMTSEMLWKLRMEIGLNSSYVSDFQNSFGFTAQSVSDFFDGYMDYLDYLDELAEEEYGNDYMLEDVLDFDNEENLYDWYGCYEYFPFELEQVDEEE